MRKYGGKKKNLPDASLPRLSGDECLPVVNVCAHRRVFMHACMECVSVQCACIGVLLRVRTEGDC